MKEIEALIPVCLDLDWPTKDTIVECIREQNKLYGFKKFLLSGPGAGYRSGEYPKKQVFADLANLYKSINEELADEDITLGWWDTLTVKSGRSKDFQPIVKSDGTDHPFANCPLDSQFILRFSENVAEFARIAKPSLIIFEDDYSINAAAGGFGCFCPLHLREFERREGKKYTREELLHLFKSESMEGINLFRRYRALTRDSMVKLSEAIRNEVDKSNPEIPIGLMQPGSSDTDGDSTEAVSRALAGKNHTPFSRIFGAYYCGGELKGIPQRIFHAIYSREHIEGDFKFYHESDTFPHTRFFSSAKEMKTFMGIAYSSGFIGSTFQTQQLLDDPNEECAYGKMFSAERARFSTLINLVAGCKRVGVSLPYDPFLNTLRVKPQENDPCWTRTLSLFGIPYTTKDADITFLDSRQAKYVSEKKILGYLSSCLFLDGDAAYELCKRGFGKYLGVSVGEDVAARGKVQYDLGAREVFRAPFDEFSKGKNMPIAHMFCSGGNGILRELFVTDDNTEVISEAYTFDKKLLSVAMTRFENALGGRIVVMGMTTKGNLSQSLFNYRRMRLFNNLLLWCGAKFPLVKGEPCVHLIFNEATDPAASGFSCMLTAINLGDDTIAGFDLILPENIATKRAFYIDCYGSLAELATTRTEDGIYVDKHLESAEPLYIIFK